MLITIVTAVIKNHLLSLKTITIYYHHLYYHHRLNTICYQFFIITLHFNFWFWKTNMAEKVHGLETGHVHPFSMATQGPFGPRGAYLDQCGLWYRRGLVP